MPVTPKFRIVDNSFLVNVNGFKQRIKNAVQKGLNDGADELRDYIKDELLSGQLVQKRTSQLRNALYVRRGKDKIEILFRGTHKRISDPENDIPNSVLAQILEEGLNKSWFQPKRNRWHHGIKPHYFMRTGLRKKRARIISLVQYQINSALRSKKQG